MKKCRLYFSFIVSLLCIYALALATPLTSLAAQEIKVGVLFPVTGPIAKTGITYFKGCEYAVSKINLTGGIKSLGGTKLKLVKADSQAKIEIGMSETERLIREGVVAILGAYQSSVTYPTTQIAERSKIPYIVTGSIADEITERGFKYTFRPHARNTNYGKDAYRFFTEMAKKSGVKIKTAGVLYEDTLAGQSFAKNIKEFAKDFEIKIVADISYSHGTADVSTDILKLKAAKPDIVFQTSYIGDAIVIAKKMKELNFNTMGIIGGGAAHHQPEFIQELGPLSEYWFVVCGWNPMLKTPGQKEVVEEFQKQFGEPMKEDGIIAISNMYLLRDSMERAGSTDGERLREALAGTNLKVGEKGCLFPYGTEYGPDGQNVHATLIVDQNLNLVRTTVWPRAVALKEAVFPIPSWGERK